MAPYRSREESTAAPEAPETGLVEEMVRQFADPYAFLRELIQNGIDAGATAIEVRIDLLLGGMVTSQVSDDGSGMTREVIEGPLLTLFSSSKEDDSTKIGKYGVGFVSVFALSPEEVIVDSWRDGGAWRVRLRRDHSYDLEQGEPREGSGTTVTLVQAMDRAGFERQKELARAALLRWCRHAQVPIHLTITDAEHPDATTRARIDTPLAIAATVSITEQIEGETFVVGCGTRLEEGADLGPPEERAETFAGFYNRGLTLYEHTGEATRGLRHIRFKVLSAALHHTLSRDNVRRDAEYDRVIARVRELAGRPLRRELARRLREAAREAAGGKCAAYPALLELACRPPLALKRHEIELPLAAPVEAHATLSFTEVVKRTPWRAPILISSRSSRRLIEAIAREGRPVIRADHPEIAARLSEGGGLVAHAGNVQVLLVEASAGARCAWDEAFGAAVQRSLAAAGVKVARVALCSVSGASAGRSWFVVPRSALREGKPLLCSTDQIRSWAKRWSARRVLFLVASSRTVIRARGRAERDPALAGYLLARLLLLDWRGPMSPRSADRLLAHVAREMEHA
jgi:Histidine kinase-, DNA gyrase B-, and HSP90-like ATPase